jgi:ABC-type lipoprotein release transport system permease subunit
LLLQKKNIVGMILCILLFSASVPILIGVRDSPESMFKGDDVITLTQTNINTPISASLAQRLNNEEFIDAASPEIYAFSYIISRKSGEYQPVLVRGVDPSNFLKIENAEMQSGDYAGNFMLAGEGVAKRLGIIIGNSITITGSTHPSILEGTVSGIFTSPTSSNDQILIPLASARKLMGLSGDNILSIRIKTENEQKLIDFLTEEEYSVLVSKKDGIPVSVNHNKTYEEQIAEELAFKYSDTEKFSSSNQSFISTFIQKGSGTVGVVVLGFIVLNALLTFIGITAILGRGVIERRKDIGILAAIGANKRTIYFVLLKDLLVISTIASGIGVILGFITAVFVQNMDLIVAFGITIQPSIDLVLFVVTFFVAIIIGCTSGLLASSLILTERPSKLMQETEDVKEEMKTETLTEAVGV